MGRAARGAGRGQRARTGARDERGGVSPRRAEPKPQPLDPPAAGRLHEIAVPTLVIVGDLDTTGTLAMANQMAGAIPGARKVVIPGVAHMVNMEEPARFNEVVLGFLDSIEQ